MTQTGRLGAFGLAALLMACCGSGGTAGPAPPSPASAEPAPKNHAELPEADSRDIESGDLREAEDRGGKFDTGAASDPESAPADASLVTGVVPGSASEEPAESQPAAGDGHTASSLDGVDGSQSPPRAGRSAPDWPSQFEQGTAPAWPFRGLVQLWHIPPSWGGQGWVLRYWSWDADVPKHSQVNLDGMEVGCLGRVALVVHGEHGVEVGGPPGDVSAAYWVRWGDVARPADAPSGELLDAVARRPSNVAVGTEGDAVFLGQGSQERVYEMRRPLRGSGERWRVQARHDGELFVMTVHPAHLECFPGVTWLSLAASGELVACGANTAATAFVDLQRPAADLVLPEPRYVGTYLSCAPPLELTRGLW
ncbi:MAG: hypothetical protein OXR64_04060 [Chloroflexota bacterium]|nr:hypothetical protein [Chloroflexota bacterium]